MAAIDLTLIRQFQTGYGLRLLETFTAGSTVGIHFRDRDCDIVANGFVTSRQGDSVWADFLSRARQPRNILSRPAQQIDIRVPGPIMLSSIMRGRNVRVVDLHPQGYSLQVTGVVTESHDDAFKLGDGHWFNWHLFGGRLGAEIDERD